MNVTRAIAAFERTLITSDSAYEGEVKPDKTALTEQQLRGRAPCRADGGRRCHQRPAFDAPALAAGTAFTRRLPSYPRSAYAATYRLVANPGRAQWTGKEPDPSQWRVPSLRNLTYTTPFIRNGLVPILASAVRAMSSTEPARTLTDAEVADLVALLETLPGPPRGAVG